MLTFGFHASGLQDVLRQAGVPKGSFYHFFASKEAFVVAVVERYAQSAAERRRAVLNDAATPPLVQARRLFEADLGALTASGLRGGCLLGNLSVELADHSDAVRAALAAGFEAWEADVRSVLARAERQGALPAPWTAGELAAFCINAWEGAIVRARADRNEEALRLFLVAVFERLLRA